MAEPATILLVDDTQEILDMAGRFLRARGFEVITTDAPFSVLQSVRDESPDVLILDAMIPALDGDALARFVGAESNIPIVFYSAASEEYLAKLQANHPQSRVVRKGEPLAALEAAVRAALA